MFKNSFEKLVKWAQGRHTLFAIFFALYGCVLQWFNKLDLNYIYLIGAIQGLVLGHSIKEDWFVKRIEAQNPTAPVVLPDPKGGADAA